MSETTAKLHVKDGDDVNQVVSVKLAAEFPSFSVFSILDSNFLSRYGAFPPTRPIRVEKKGSACDYVR